MSTMSGVWEKAAVFLIWVIFLTWGSRLPKYVDQQINNQLTEGIKDEMLPLQQVSCFQGLPINCFFLKKRPKAENWLFAEFQISSHEAALGHEYRLLAYSKIPEVYGSGNILFASDPRRPDPILSDLIFDISPVITKLFRTSEEIFIILACADCGDAVIYGNDRQSIGFIILRSKKKGERVKRSLVDNHECKNDGDLEKCCVNKRLTSKSLVFENASNIVAPMSIPISYCGGSCYMNMYKGNHNFALLKYYHSLFGQTKTKLMKSLPCCNAKEFRDMAILYVMQDGSPEMVLSKNLIVDSCSCE